MRPFISHLAALFICLCLTASAESGPAAKMNVYRCTDTKGKVSLQDVPCADAGSQQVLEMTRPKDAEPAKKIAPDKPAVIVAGVPMQPASIAFRPAPDLFRCTDFDGNVRDSEVFDTNPRCVPLWVLGYDSSSTACTWVEDSCVRYEGQALCERWRERLRQAELDQRHAPSSQVAYLRSEVARFEQIVRTSCR